MLSRQRASLNAIRAFTIVSRTGSLTAAGTELCVTASAVSHQLKNLEAELGVRLFSRGSNTISLTEMGRRFYLEVAPAISLVDRATEDLMRSETEVRVQASTSLAVRWLIPLLDHFHAAHPQAQVRVGTIAASKQLAALDADISIRYFRAAEVVPEGWELLVEDLSRPVASPSLLSKSGKARNTLGQLPALQRAAGNWDWKYWCKVSGISPASLVFAYEFDTDDAALRASVAGLGMVLAPPILTAREIESKVLVAVPGYEAVRIGSYRYQRRGDSSASRAFCEWIRAEATDSH